MLYSQADRNAAIAKLKRRAFVVWLPTAFFLALAVIAFIWYRLQHDDSGWIVSGLFTILAGGYCIFFYGVYLRPMLKYKKHLDYMLDGHKRETVGILKEISETIQDKDGIDCYSVLLNIGEKDDPEDDRLFYLDSYKSMADFKVGERIRLESNDRIIASVVKVYR